MLAIDKRGWRFEIVMTMKKSSQWPKRNSNPELCMSDCESDVLSTRPRCQLRFARGLSLPALHLIAWSEKKKKLFILFYFFLQAKYSEGQKTESASFWAYKADSPSKSYIQLSTTTPSVKVYENRSKSLLIHVCSTCHKGMTFQWTPLWYFCFTFGIWRWLFLAWGLSQCISLKIIAFFCLCRLVTIFRWMSEPLFPSQSYDTW